MKRSWWQLIGLWLVGLCVCLIVGRSSQALDLPLVAGVARQTTVVVAQDLKQGDNQALREAFRPGSGVLIGKQGDYYYVLTNAHVVSARGTDYGVRTADGVVHFVDDLDTNDNILPLGKIGQNVVEGTDLAIVRFQAPGKNYPIVTVNPQKIQFEPVFVSGWPDPGPQFPSRTFRLTSGMLSTILSKAEDGDYNMQYSAPTRRGMSGGPVFNSRGELIAIHGRGGGKNLPEYGKPDQDCTKDCFNRGIAIDIFLTKARRDPRYAPVLASAPPPPSEVARLPATPAAQFIEDIYKLFSDLRQTRARVDDLEKRLERLR
ncbi:MAG: serine protease [Pseudanabaenaceae cyanobacterium SKYGB_i_bin29]|nr:serine protease [Pseudanabaenaceae cyanobacterium SKYG29]MDW8421043.1 serine protease [Pseudanabaenaceae cyanobacterium SKYGB_i_bin29]